MRKKNLTSFNKINFVSLKTNLIFAPVKRKIHNIMTKNENNTKKYTVKVSNNETEVNFGFNKVEIAKAAASLFTLDDKYDTVMLIDNEINKGIHFDPMTDLTKEQRDKIKEHK